MPGGRIAPDGRNPAAPGVGANSKRHDLERRDVPYMHGSDLQQGDIQAMRDGQRVAPRATQQPAQPRPAPAQAGSGGGQPSAAFAPPDPLQFLGDRLAGTLQRPGVARAPRNPIDVAAWMPLVQRLATAPGGSGIMGQAFITQIGNLSRIGRTYETPLIDMQDADDDLDYFLNG